MDLETELPDAKFRILDSVGQHGRRAAMLICLAMFHPRRPVLAGRGRDDGFATTRH